MSVLSVIIFEIEQDLYNEVSTICHNAGTTIEKVTEAFLRFCIVPENLPLLKAFLGIGKASSKGDVDRDICDQVLCGVCELL